ncbi:hypothetical protein [Amycolatopsis sp. WGS_07]|uniref:hypothetical protein n=1 Tax=Amycolatopsis sp. WGS_07 TaxID=3076764 RepID=UPI003873A498
MHISRDRMADLIRTGHAQPWTHPVGPGGTVWTAARIWHVSTSAANGYAPASARLAAALGEAQDVTALPDPPAERINEVVSRVRRILSNRLLENPAPEPAAMLSREQMADLLDQGIAEPWTGNLGPDTLAPVAARVWYAVAQGENVYRPMTGIVASVLDSARAALVESARQESRLSGQ